MSGRLHSVMSNRFSMIPRAHIPRSTFNRSHGYKTTFNAGALIPIYIDEALPGDTFNCKLTALARLATPVVPVMDNLYLDFFFFAVPNRLVWTNWQKFMGERDNPEDDIDYLVPQMTGDLDIRFEDLQGTIVDYFGLPIYQFNLDPGAADPPVSALPFRAYWLIWNEWFRDQNLQRSFPVPLGDGPDNYSLYFSSVLPPVDLGGLAPRNKRHDYFTSCLPWPQKGPGVEIPLGAEAPVKLYENWPTPTQPTLRSSATGLAVGGATDLNLLALDSGVHPGTPQASLGYVVSPTEPRPLVYDPKETLYTDLSTATAATINSLRQAFQIQKLLERDARGGTRYIEILRSHFGVVSPDSRLQRPEYLGGGTIPMIFNPVAQTSGTGSSEGAYTPTPQGNLAAYGVCSSSGLGFVKSFVEHSIIIGLVSARVDISYQNGINRMWWRRTRYDYYWPALAHLGEQAVLNQELLWLDDPVADQKPATWNTDVFGYQERWAEYRYYPTQVTGLFRLPGVKSTFISPLLSFWTFSESFDSQEFQQQSQPYLNPRFITDQSKEILDRVLFAPANLNPDFAKNAPYQILFDSFFDIKCARPMPAYSVPGFIDHF